MEKMFREILAKRLLMVNGDINKVAYPEKPLRKMNTHEIREYVTFYYAMGYYGHLIANNISSEERKQIERDMNKEWDARINNDLVALYNFFDKKENVDKWGGEVRFQLFSYLCKGDTEFYCLKKANAMLLFLRENNISVQQFLEMCKILDCKHFSDGTLNIGEDNEKATNKEELRNQFVDFILNDARVAIAN